MFPFVSAITTVAIFFQIVGGNLGFVPFDGILSAGYNVMNFLLYAVAGYSFSKLCQVRIEKKMRA